MKLPIEGFDDHQVGTDLEDGATDESECRGGIVVRRCRQGRSQDRKPDQEAYTPISQHLRGKRAAKDRPLTTHTIDPNVKATATQKLISALNPGFNSLSKCRTLPEISWPPDPGDRWTCAVLGEYRPFRARRDCQVAVGTWEWVSWNVMWVGVKALDGDRWEPTLTEGMG